MRILKEKLVSIANGFTFFNLWKGDGSQVTVTPKVTEGINIASIDVDGETSELYAPEVIPTNIEVTQIQTEGTHIADITIDGNTTELYAPSGESPEPVVSGGNVKAWKLWSALTPGTTPIGAFTIDNLLDNIPQEDVEKYNISTLRDLDVLEVWFRYNSTNSWIKTVRCSLDGSEDSIRAAFANYSSTNTRIYTRVLTISAFDIEVANGIRFTQGSASSNNTDTAIPYRIVGYKFL